MKVSMNIVVLILTAMLLGGCLASPEELLPTEGHSMRDVWDKNVGDSQLYAYRSQDGRRLDPVDYVANKEAHSYTRTAENEIENLFPKLPNPDLIMYIYPHLSSSGEPLPVPGYSTVIPFYSRVQYAMPGERTRGL